MLSKIWVPLKTITKIEYKQKKLKSLKSFLVNEMYLI